MQSTFHKVLVNEYCQKLFKKSSHKMDLYPALTQMFMDITGIDLFD